MDKKKRETSSEGDEDDHLLLGNNGNNGNTRRRRRRRKRKASAKKSGDANISGGFGNDVMIEILRRLPAASLARFRCVCKQWRDLACDHGVILEHAALSCQTSPPRLAALSYQYLCVDSSAASLVFAGHLTRYDETLAYKYRLRAPNWRVLPNRSVSIGLNLLKISNSCHGLACIYNTKGVRLMNLATREYVNLPEPENYGETPFQRFHLGFDPVTNEYKVLLISRLGFVSLCQVLTLGKRISCLKWRPISYINYFTPDVPSIAVNGRIYMIAVCCYSAPTDKVATMVSFDLKDETLEVIPWPTVTTDLLNIVECYDGVLAALNGNACWIVFDESGKDLVDVWVLKDAVKHIWVSGFRCAKTLFFHYGKPWHPKALIQSVICNEAGCHQEYVLFGCPHEETLVSPRALLDMTARLT